MTIDRIKLLQQFLEEDPYDAFTNYALALEYGQSGERQKAISLLMNLLDKHPDYLPAYYQLGRFLELTDQKIRALETYKQGITLAQKSGNIHTAKELKGAVDALNDNTENQD